MIAQQAKETAKATQAMRDSVEVLIKKERARIRVEVENLKLVGSNQAGKFNAALCKLMNYGYTEAFIDDFRAILLLVPEKDIPANYAKCKQLQFGQSIPPQGRSPNFMMVFLEPDMVLTDVAVMSIKKNESFVHFYGFVKYRTVFDRRMRATVHLRWTMQWGGMIEGQIMEWWEAVGPPEENSDTEDKEPN